LREPHAVADERHAYPPHPNSATPMNELAVVVAPVPKSSH
jgi:hypothetical protein